MTGLRAELGRLEQLVENLARFERRAQEAAADTDREVRRLHGEWIGAAAQAHLAAHRRWVDGTASMCSALCELRALAAVAHANYAAAVAANAQMWS